MFDRFHSRRPQATLASRGATNSYLSAGFWRFMLLGASYPSLVFEMDPEAVFTLESVH